MLQAALAENELSLTTPAQGKMAELMAQVEDNIQGVRVFATPGGCSGVSFGMTFTDQLNDDDRVREYEGVRVIVDTGTLEYIRGVEIDFVDAGDGDARFVFNNLQPTSGGGCGTCGSQGGCS
ncbi:MAG: iron-sulfur cluster assembly accessory protein [Chromatiaceae bacterium]|nr:iron-sulfur cluster assembly accessory protein [Gammaproteobacteria bacterium]MCP5299951.1 iron-sulfur cluster assembly accessory protein [Chromatiaceae bacterium]MCP5422025.1 iron-sulfur cluster assembly accessory protein [Chromatiaceae bacterium]